MKVWDITLFEQMSLIKGARFAKSILMQSDVGKMELNIRSTENTKRENTPRLGTSVIFVNFVVKNQGRRRRKHSTSPEAENKPSTGAR